MKILLLGFGSIGRHIVRLLDYDFTAMVRDVAAHRERGTMGVKLITAEQFDDAVTNADLVVEAAGVAVAKQFLPRVHKPFVLTSVGALADPEVAEALMTPHLHVTNGAIGGFDVLEAVADQLDQVSITTSKDPTGLIQPWMSEAEATRLEKLTEPEVLFSGNPIAAIEKFPGNVNVSVALAYATRGAKPLAEALQRVQVTLVADPQHPESAHVIEASGAAGRFRFEFAASPSPINPATSGTTALSLAATIRRIAPYVRRG
ncbi:aspartate dehydrogenase domain-containing protein [Enteractinococcus coprophilus]|uniref:Aspartate dehydrogenase n=1 Tax=Enteractinococcus coprophilus TaxID=1027633 RepID=A0A543ANI5_9MICC|nr:aspartate dehydrogenase domain-containing protein [Enteractinococcus coprophilus]TQL74140.1 aspartate dehydrogenase [Enteractinococcus coprophilus]